MVVLNS